MPTLSIGEFHDILRRTGAYESPPDAVRRPPLGSFRAWWRFYAVGLGGLIRNGSRHVRAHSFQQRHFAILSHRMVANAEATGATVQFEGFLHLSALGGRPAVIVANHMSLVETMILPGGLFAFNDVSVVAKRSLTRYPGFGPILASVRPILLDRKNPRQDLADVLEQGAELLKDGLSVLLFPQGHRSAVFDPKLFNSLGAKLARKAGAPLVPVACKTDFARQGFGPFKDVGPVDPSKPIRFACGPAIDPSVPQREMQDLCVEHISSTLRAWGMPVAGDAPAESASKTI